MIMNIEKKAEDVNKQYVPLVTCVFISSVDIWNARSNFFKHV